MKRSEIALKEEISALKEALYLARRTILDLMPEHARKHLYSYSDCKSRGDAYKWRSSIVATLTVAAEPPPVDIAPRDYVPRLMCPLCGYGGQLGKGYQYPEGLQRHFEGRLATSCPVIEAAFALCLDHAKGDDGFVFDFR